MRNKHFIFLSLLSAYLLMFTHSIIPHHHLENLQKSQAHSHTEQTAHHHHNAGERHGHTPRFVHSPDFGNYIPAPFLKLTNLPQLHLNVLFLVPPSEFNFHVQPFVAKMGWFVDLPPPQQSHTPIPNGLRGSPISISLA
jgi:hypothetical protein